MPTEMTNELSAAEVDAQLRDARDGIQTLIGRADTKAQAMLATHSLALAGAVALFKTLQPSTWGGWLLGVAMVVFAAALITALLVILPRLGRTATGLTAWARQDAAAIRAAASAEYAGEDVAAHVGTLSRIAVCKFWFLQVAVWLVITGLALAGLALTV